MRRARLIPLLFLLAGPRLLVAQWKLSGDAGYARIEQPELPTLGTATGSVTLDFAREYFLIHSSALGAQASDGRETGQLLTLGSVVSPAWNAWAIQGTGVLSAFAQTTLSATTSRDLLIQARTGGPGRGFAIGGGLGTTVHNAVAIPNQRAQGDGWYALGRERFNADVSVTRTRSLFGGSSILVDISRRNVNYLDASGGWTHDAGAWSVSGSFGVRGQSATFTGGNTWQAFNATAWVDRNLGLVVDVGNTLEDLVRGVPRSKYLSVALRFESQPHLSIFRRTPTIAGPRATITRLSDTRRVEITNVKAMRVELMADFTDWNPVELSASGSRWRLEQSDIAPGLHRLAIRIDGGAWIVPANLPHADDELLGPVGLITVP
ncbi:MAG TPA: hypothetical protein VGM82_20575 [Gemmatimonadaceae bacterium]|jgi:hypothetical protein